MPGKGRAGSFTGKIYKTPPLSAKITGMEEQISRSAGGIGAAILGSRILGFARDLLFAKYFGTGVTAQAFFAAFRIPNLMRRLFGEGALSASFIPVFTEQYHAKGRDEAWKLAAAVLNILSAVLAAAVVLGVMFAPAVTRAVVPGFRDVPGQAELTAYMMRLMFPYLFFICLAALMMGILNSLKHFAAPALAPMLLNVSIISYLVFFMPGARNPAAGLGIAVLAGGAAQFLLQAAVVTRKGFSFRRLGVFYHPKVKRIAALMLPATAGLAIYQLNVFVDGICASYEDVVGTGAFAALWYADRLMQFPLSIFGIATATAVFPVMSRAVSAEDFPLFGRTLAFGLRNVFFLTVPSSVGLIVLRTPIIRVLFERNAFTPESTLITASALMYYSIGLFAYAGVHIVSRGFYSLQDTRTPVKVAGAVMLLNVVLNLSLMWPLKVGGIALATSVSAAVNLGILVFLMRRRMIEKNVVFEGGAVLASFLRVLSVSLIMGAVLAVLWRVMPEAESTPARAAQLGGVILAGVSVFVLLSSFLGLAEMKTARSSLFRRSGRGG